MRDFVRESRGNRVGAERLEESPSALQGAPWSHLGRHGGLQLRLALERHFDL